MGFKDTKAELQAFLDDRKKESSRIGRYLKIHDNRIFVDYSIGSQKIEGLVTLAEFETINAATRLAEKLMDLFSERIEWMHLPSGDGFSIISLHQITNQEPGCLLISDLLREHEKNDQIITETDIEKWEGYLARIPTY